MRSFFSTGDPAVVVHKHTTSKSELMVHGIESTNEAASPSQWVQEGYGRVSGVRKGIRVQVTLESSKTQCFGSTPAGTSEKVPTLKPNSSRAVNPTFSFESLKIHQDPLFWSLPICRHEFASLDEHSNLSFLGELKSTDIYLPFAVTFGGHTPLDCKLLSLFIANYFQTTCGWL